MSTLAHRLAGRRVSGEIAAMLAQGILFGTKAGGAVVGKTTMTGVSGSIFDFGGLQNMLSGGGGLPGFSLGGLDAYLSGTGGAPVPGTVGPPTASQSAGLLGFNGRFSAVGAGLGVLRRGLFK